MLNCQDYLTECVILWPLKAKTALAIVHEVLDIFLLFGAPSILQTDNGHEFVNQVIDTYITWTYIWNEKSNDIVIFNFVSCI